MSNGENKLGPEGYSGLDYWDEYHEIARVKAIDRSVKLKVWLEAFFPLLNDPEGTNVLDLGCGSGHDAVALSKLGFEVSGCDISAIAIDEAQALALRQAQSVDFRQHDIAMPLPYENDSFAGVICNLTLHMFTPDVAQRIVDEVRRCLQPQGLFAFHVNSTEDLPFRRKLQPPVIELGGGMYCFGRGQTMRFFSEADCRGVLEGMDIVMLEPVKMLRADGAVQKCAWRCAARKT